MIVTAYNKDAPPPAISGFSGPTELGGSINAPSGYMGYQFFPFSQSQGYDPSTCASACTQQTTYNSKHPGSDGSFQTCVSPSLVPNISGIRVGMEPLLIHETHRSTGLLQRLCHLPECYPSRPLLYAVQPSLGSIVRHELWPDEG